MLDWPRAWRVLVFGFWAAACAEPVERWRLVSGGGGENAVRAVLLGPGGESWAAGSFRHQVPLGRAVLTNDFLGSGASSGFVTRLSSGGKVDWAFQLGQAAPSEALALAETKGTLWVGGTFAGELTLGSLTRTSRGESDAFLLGCSAADGSPSVLISWGGGGRTRVVTMTALDDGDLIVGGNFTGVLDLGQGPMRSSGGGAFIARLSSSGAFRWSRQIGSSDFDSVAGMASCGADCVGVLGTFESELAIGGETIRSLGATDLFVAALDPRNGAPLWVRGIGSASLDQAGSVAASPGGELVVAGTTTGRLEVAADSVDDGAPHAFLGKLDSTGAIGWFTVLAGPGASDGYGAAVNARGEPVLAGSFSGRIGETDLAGHGNTIDGFVFAFDPEGTMQWAHSWGEGGDDVTWDVSVNTSGDVLLGGSLAGRSQFDPRHDSVDASELVVLQLRP